MPRVDIVRSVPIVRTPRLMQVEGLFDVPPSQRSEERWTVDLDLPDEWNVGVIVGPSGAGKTTVAGELFGTHLVGAHEWPADKSVVDGFPEGMSIKDIVALLSSVGFSSPPSWVRPFHVLSNGEQFRVNLARTLAEQPDLAVVDEFTSVVDRTVAQIGSAAVAKTVRRRNQRFIAVTCHYDILDWLEPDWVYEPHTGELERGRLRQRPAIDLEVFRVDASAWQLFRRHHYLDTRIHANADCFVACWDKRPVAFSAWMHFPHPSANNLKREHRTVCLPDFQGVGIGNAISDFMASAVRGIGCRPLSITSHPGMMRHRTSSQSWRVIARPNIKTKTMPRGSMQGRKTGVSQSNGPALRLRASFEYIGSALDPDEARAVWSGVDHRSAPQQVSLLEMVS